MLSKSNHGVVAILLWDIWNYKNLLSSIRSCPSKEVLNQKIYPYIEKFVSSWVMGLLLRVGRTKWVSFRGSHLWWEYWSSILTLLRWTTLVWVGSNECFVTRIGFLFLLVVSVSGRNDLSNCWKLLPWSSASKYFLLQFEGTCLLHSWWWSQATMSSSFLYHVVGWICLSSRTLWWRLGTSQELWMLLLLVDACVHGVVHEQLANVGVS